VAGCGKKTKGNYKKCCAHSAFVGDVRVRIRNYNRKHPSEEPVTTVQEITVRNYNRDNPGSKATSAGQVTFFNHMKSCVLRSAPGYVSVAETIAREADAAAKKAATHLELTVRRVLDLER
jgi:hypothetical protein